MNILFVTWDGPQVSYLEGLFLPIFQALKAEGIYFHVLQFTWGDTASIDSRRVACENAGCGYEVVKVIRKPIALGSLMSAIMGGKHILRAIKQQKIDVVMPRSTLPALSSFLALRGRNERLVFDADGLPLDEKVEFSGISNTGLIHRILRDIEAQAVRRADAVLTRSPKASEILLARAGAGVNADKFINFNNGRDSEFFSFKSDLHSRKIKSDLGISEDMKLVIYVGSIGGKYLLHEMLKLFFHIKNLDQNVHFLILTADVEKAVQEISKGHFSSNSITVMSVSSASINKYIAAADLGLALIKPSYSMQAVSVLKIGEYLLSGVPVICTAGIGNSSQTCSKAGFVIGDLDDSSLKLAARWFFDDVIPNKVKYRDVSRSAGLLYYSSELTVAAYKKAILGNF